MKAKILAIIIIGSLVFVGCVSTKNVPVAASDIDDLRNHTVAVPKRKVPDFGAFTADKTAGQAVFGLIGGIAGAVATISEGNRIVRENEIEDPANYISQQLLSALSDTYQMTPIDTVSPELESEEVDDISRVFEAADYVLDVRTINWSFWYFPSDWNNYRVMYSSKLRLIDTKKSVAIAEGFCSRFPEEDEDAPSYDELLFNNARRLKDELKISADYCVDYFKKEILGLQTITQASAEIDHPELNQGDGQPVSKSEALIGRPAGLTSQLDIEKQRLADELARVEQLRREIAQLKAEKSQEPGSETPKLAYITERMKAPRVSLRKEPLMITNQGKITEMLRKYDFFDYTRNAFGSFENGLIDNHDGTVTDGATGLMWQKSGSLNFLNNMRAKEYIKQLNRKRFADYSGWRMPTVEELASLLKKGRIKGIHLAPVFDNKQIRCWTIDECDPSYALYSGAWIVDFKEGTILESWYYKYSDTGGTYVKNIFNHVKAVRSLE